MESMRVMAEFVQTLPGPPVMVLTLIEIYKNLRSICKIIQNYKIIQNLYIQNYKKLYKITIIFLDPTRR